MAEKNKPNEIHITRVYDAPVAAVWDAWTDSKQVAQWWGPRGFTLTTHSKDLKAGGHWHYTMHGPNGADYVNKTQYLEVEKHVKMVYDHGGNDERKPLFRVTVLFSESKGKTTMEMTMALPTAQAAEETRGFIKKAGGEATWDRLAEYLEKERSGAEKFVINRTFDAPLAVMFDMWTKPDHFSRWLAPTGFEMRFIRSDIRPGGSSFYVMTGGNVTMYGRAQYLKIEKPGLIIYTQQFCDENERISRHPGAPTWPETMLSTVTLTAEGPDRTRVTVFWEAHGTVTPEELAAFVKERAGMTQGWTGSFDKLEKLLLEELKKAGAR
jgi:uncharacterized protein YndB with AHSA1/START domain